MTSPDPHWLRLARRPAPTYEARSLLVMALTGFTLALLWTLKGFLAL